MTKKMKNRHYRADLTLCLSRSLFEGNDLAKIEILLRQAAPGWASDIHIFREGDARPRRDISEFASDVRNAALERGDFYEHLIAKHGPGPAQRRTGTVELRGSDDSLVVVLDLDEYQFAPSGGCWIWANTVSLQCCQPSISELDATTFIRRMAERACDELSPWYAHAELSEEYDHKNMSREGGGMMAVGVDASRYLPGLYWLNFFGDPYCALIGRERLLSTPAHEIVEIYRGVLIVVSSDPQDWNTPEYQHSESRILRHLGEQHFFNRNAIHRETVAPDFGLEPLPRHPRFT